MTRKIIFVFTLFTLLFSCNLKNTASEESFVKLKLAWSGPGPDFITGDISTDGTYFTDINWNTGDIKLINLETKKERDLTGQGYNTGGYAWMSSFSNSGDQLAYEWYNYDTGSHELRLYTFKDSLVKTLVPSQKEITYLEPLDWSQNDEQILLAKQYNEKYWELGMFTIENGSYETIIQLDWKTPGGLHPFAYPSAYLSPDGNFIGFDYKTTPAQNNNLVLVSIETGEVHVLFEGEGDNRFLSWTKDGTEVLFYSNHSGVPSVWKLRVKNGKNLGKPELVKNSIEGLSPIGLTEKGLAYGVELGSRNTYIAEVNFNSGEIINAPTSVDSSCYCRNNVGDWSKEGDSLLFIRFRELPSSRESAVIKSVITGQEREIFFPWAFHNKTGSVTWISENKVLVDGNSPEQSGLHIFDLYSKELKFIDLGNEGFFQRFISNSDGSKIYVQMRFDHPRIVEFDIETGKKRTIFEGTSIPASVAISSDDNTLAFLQNNPETKKLQLKTLNLHSRTLRTLRIPNKGRLSAPVSWNPNGAGIFVGVSFSREEKGLWHIDLNALRDPIFIKLPDVQAPALLASPNGKHLAFQSGDSNGNLYFLEGF